jgi:hypothetical protein
LGIIYRAADAVSTTCGREGACAVVVVGVLVIDLIKRAALVAMQTHSDFLELLTTRGREAALTTTRTSKKVAKIAKRRIGRPPDGGYGRPVIRVP